jgi:hypothetical protein
VQLSGFALLADRNRICSLIQSVSITLARRKQAWEPAELDVLWDVAIASADMGGCYYLLDFLRIPLAATERLGEPDRYAEQLRRSRVLCDDGWQDQLLPVKNRIDTLLVQAGLLTVEEQAASILSGDDEFTKLLNVDLSGSLNLLRHWRTATSPQPTQKWTKQVLDLLNETSPNLMRALLQHAQRHCDGLAGETATLMRGLTWSLEHVTADCVVPALGDLAITAGTGSGSNARCEILANAAVGVLAKRPEADAVAQLSRILAKVKRKSILNNARRALETIATRTGLTPDQLVERTVPTFGLDATGVRTERAGEFTITLSLGPAGPALSFTGPDGKRRASVPKAVKDDHPELLADLKETLKELKKVLPAERHRLENALATGRTWPAADWQEYYLDHPLTGAFTRNLIWEYSTGTGWTPFLPPTECPPEATVRLWHPIRAEVAEVRAWRDRFFEQERRQPFKQAYREIYLLTPAEEQTRTYSNRFAAHVLKYGQAKMLLQGRGWSGPQLGYWDGGYDGQATKKFGDLTAQFYVDLVETMAADNYGTPSYCTTDQAKFLGSNSEPVPLSEVPPLVLSEVMRDLDLAVGVTSIAADPQWADRGEERHYDYWHQTAFGALTESATARHEALTRLLPRLKIADRLELTDRFLRVHGTRRTYKIHLGSTNILMEPNDAYLCIVVAARGPGDRVFLPFEDDRLSVILSKAFLLADDDKITDPTILQQL